MVTAGNRGRDELFVISFIPFEWEYDSRQETVAAISLPSSHHYAGIGLRRFLVRVLCKFDAGSVWEHIKRPHPVRFHIRTRGRGVSEMIHSP